MNKCRACGQLDTPDRLLRVTAVRTGNVSYLHEPSVEAYIQAYRNACWNTIKPRSIELIEDAQPSPYLAEPRRPLKVLRLPEDMPEMQGAALLPGSIQRQVVA